MTDAFDLSAITPPRWRLPAIAALLTPLLLAGCAGLFPGQPKSPVETLESRDLINCHTLFLTLEQQLEATGTKDRGAHRVGGFPYLRSNRFLASFAGELDSPARLATWIEHLAELDTRYRSIELKNLMTATPSFANDAPSLPSPEHLDACRQQLVTNLQQQVRKDAHISQKLQQAAQVADEYRTLWRIAGVYPLAALPVAVGIQHWHAESLKTFAAAAQTLPTAGQLKRWHSQGSPPPRAALANNRPDTLGIPRIHPDQLQQLFQQHAPIWEVDVVDDNDMIGTPAFVSTTPAKPQTASRLHSSVETSQATQYQYLSHTRFQNQVLIQLNYTIWFKARPGNDIYSGRFDGLTWRVTLGPDRMPWLYDSIHNCGCYHTYFPTPHLRLKAPLPGGLFEPPLVPHPAPTPPLVVRLDSARHFIQNVYPDNIKNNATGDTTEPQPPLPVEVLETAPYDTLLSLPTPQGNRSLFDQRGLIAASARPERFILWPMGVISAGAMRQRGRHAVAFIGRRHFDDAFLIQQLFERTKSLEK